MKVHIKLKSDEQGQIKMDVSPFDLQKLSAASDGKSKVALVTFIAQIHEICYHFNKLTKEK